MLYPILTECARVPAPKFSLSIDRNTYPWHALFIQDESIAAWPNFEWGIDPDKAAGPSGRETSKGILGMLSFTFEVETGRLMQVEIPDYWIGQCATLKGNRATDHIASSTLTAVRIDPEFWKNAQRGVERTVAAPVAAVVTPDRLHLEFGNTPVVWLTLAPQVWIGQAADGAFAGFSYQTDEIDMAYFFASRWSKLRMNLRKGLL